MSGPARPPASAGSWRGYVALSLAWSILLAVVIFLNRRPVTEPIIIVPPPTPAATATSTALAPSPTPGPLIIDVAGAVRAPGVYRLPPGSVVADAITAAGGAAADADLDRLNKAIALENQMQVYVPHLAADDAAGASQEGASRQPPVVPVAPARAESIPTAAPASGPASSNSGGPVNINTATLEQLDTLPGVGAVTAEKIVVGRPYSRIEDLLNVDGIGEAKFAKLKDLITVQ
jgi:competence protein ComEA